MSTNIFRIAETGIDSLLELFNLKEPMAHRINEIGLKYYAREKGLDYYPVKIKQVPHIADEVESYIRNKARLDLPKSQFSNKPGEYPSEDLLEIGGVLGFSDHLYKNTYSKKCVVNQKLKKGSLETQTIKDLKPETSIVIGWHTHKNVPNLSTGDSLKGNVNLNTLPDDVLYYELLYCPQFDEFKWYIYEPA